MVRCAVVIPCYNEQDAIGLVIEKVNKLNAHQDAFFFQPIVINDCSSDRSWEIILQSSCVRINLPINLGIGGAVQTGFKYALRHHFDYAAQVDGDGQHPPEHLLSLLTAAINNTADVTIGSRFVGDKQGFQSSNARRLGIKILSNLIQLLTGKKYHD